MINPISLVPTLLALQFAIFGWRIAREVPLGDKHKRTWLLMSDYYNLFSMLMVILFCVIIPLKSNDFPKLSSSVLGSAYTLMAFVPFMIAGHYRLFSRSGRAIYAKRKGGVPWITGQEAVIAILAFLSATAVALFIANPTLFGA